VKRSAKYLGLLAFLFALFTTSFAASVCVERLPGAKDYVIFHFDEGPETVFCVLSDGKYSCCGEGSFGDSLTVTFVLQDNSTVDKTYRVISGEFNGLSVVKLFDTYNAYITLSGREGNYLVEENIPKDYVETAADIISDAMVLQFDPVIAWFVSLEGDSAMLSYTVKRGSVPATLPSVALADCDLKINPVKSELLEKEGTTVLLYQFEVLFKDERVIPPEIDVKVMNQRVTPRIIPEEELVEVISYVGEAPQEIPVEISVRVGDCKASYSELVIPKRGSSLFNAATVAAVLAVLAVAYYLYRRSRG